MLLVGALDRWSVSAYTDFQQVPRKCQFIQMYFAGTVVWFNTFFLDILRCQPTRHQYHHLILRSNLYLFNSSYPLIAKQWIFAVCLMNTKAISNGVINKITPT